MLLRRKIQTNAAGVEAKSEPKDYASSFRWFIAFISIAFSMLLVRFWYLQIVEGDHYRQLAFNNFIKRRVVPAERGIIYDVKMRPVAVNHPSYDVTLTPAFFTSSKEPEESFNARIDALALYLSMTEDEKSKLIQTIKKTKPADRFVPLPVKSGITRDQLAKIETNSLMLHGVEIVSTSRRYYPYNELGAHQIGYVNQINDAELQKLRMYGYRMGDVTGRMGIERAYEPILRGGNGLVASVVNAQGIPQTDRESVALMKDWKDVEPISGKNIILTIDMDVQRILKDALRDYPSGAIVAVEPSTGRILGMASTPSFNPNSWSGRLSKDEYLDSNSNPYKPMLDKSLLAFFPGSIYKVVTSAAVLEEGLMHPQDTLTCPGYYEYGMQRRRFHCWKHSGHGIVSITEALASSCDVYFYKVGEKLGIDTLAEYARMFGLGEKTGIGINNEASGTVPTREWHNKRSKEGFQGGFTLSTSIGQGDVKVTPLQMALLYATIANGGTLYYPQIIDRIETADGHPVFTYPSRVHSRLPFKKETLDTIKNGLDMVVNSELGTAFNYRLSNITVAGKTGSAQVISKRVSASSVEFKYRDHAWFAAFAPIENPQIAVTVFLEHGGSGSANAGPVIMEVIERYFREIVNTQQSL
ncbi:MAG: penicillin-binding protein 2 [Proteobacteria bacterium]|nr:penicillin-binding protein 2 [Pseudomonadota bacterium]